MTIEVQNLQRLSLKCFLTSSAGDLCLRRGRLLAQKSRFIDEQGDRHHRQPSIHLTTQHTTSEPQGHGQGTGGPSRIKYRQEPLSGGSAGPFDAPLLLSRIFTTTKPDKTAIYQDAGGLLCCSIQFFKPDIVKQTLGYTYIGSIQYWPFKSRLKYSLTIMAQITSQ